MTTAGRETLKGTKTCLRSEVHVITCREWHQTSSQNFSDTSDSVWSVRKKKNNLVWGHCQGTSNLDAGMHPFNAEIGI